jgi:hypothetical protein
MTTENQSPEQDEITQQAETFHPTDDSQNHTLESAGSDFSGQDEANASPEKKDKRETLDNSGSLFKNDRKNKEAHPDITGSALVNGVEFYVSGWRKLGAKGDFYSLSFRQKDAVAAASDLI